MLVALAGPHATDVALHPEHAGHIVQPLRDILADAAQWVAATTGGVLWLVGDVHARQTRGQWLARWTVLGRGGLGLDAQLGELLNGRSQVLCIGLLEQLALRGVHAFGLGAETQVAQQANLHGEGVNLGLAQLEFSTLLADLPGVRYPRQSRGLDLLAPQRGNKLASPKGDITSPA